MARHAILTVDLGFGDAGKGSIVDYLVREHGAGTVVRFNGGGQAGHRVVTDDGRAHVFSQFGAGTLAGADTFLSRFMLLEPYGLFREAEHLAQIGVGDVFGQLTLDHRVRITTPWQIAVNRLKELARGASRHGSCGLGIGETMVDWLAHGEDVVMAADLHAPIRLREKLAFMRDINRAKLDGLTLPDTDAVAQEMRLFGDDFSVEQVAEQFEEVGRVATIAQDDFLPEKLAQEPVVFEAAQGVLLDEWYGFHPHTTWSTTTLENANRLLSEAQFDGDVTRIGVTRAYQTRHGAGPLPTELPLLTQLLPDAANGFDAWQEGFRVGWLDLVLLRYAIDVVGHLDQLAVTCLDRVAKLETLSCCTQHQIMGEWHNRLPIKKEHKDLSHQEKLTHMLSCPVPKLKMIDDEEALLDVIETAGVPVGIVSHGEKASDKKMRGSHG